MSVLVVKPGDVVILDPSESRLVVFDWDRRSLASSVQISTSTFTITALQQAGGTALTKDNPAILTASEATTALERTVSVASRATRVRLIATTATLGDEYELENVIVTDESPTQTKAGSVRIRIGNR